MNLIIASGNQHKVREIRDYLSPRIPALQISSLRDLYSSVPDIPETGTTFEENSLQKARWLYAKHSGWIIADDSGLEVNALQGAPGVYSARYAGEPCNDSANNAKLLSELSGVAPEKRTARYRAVITLLSPENKAHTFSGSCEGTIAETPSGTEGFGYDPLFIPTGYTRSFAELGDKIKEKISHRSSALRAMAEKFPQYLAFYQ
ncbi:RdgB/HAM1 family non-canonical purine NTP pyrophosphatase [Chitinivibrio alkaliphilus]|uniref:dITP/XTP pyrophosphatase n=1 Tax=Chitinivibrio alkaliphilus ACht1 TaxID=1313304 RepID=U7D809_9BACT|nr:RdgB/HAM1 family non-canonical purine NTP pyrophosphatase [Chitinivibrio alkaliphilus]ERP39090.1 non-canonical purine NTP pyrophosphatase, rdgB/HAM1 family [Chitinivibrio alkaliphilus ACht1]